MSVRRPAREARPPPALGPSRLAEVLAVGVGAAECDDDCDRSATLLHNLVLDLLVQLLPEGATEVRDSQFQGRVFANSVTLPSTVRVIGARAFYRCTSLDMPELPDRLTRIGAHAFEGCSSLTLTGLPRYLMEIGEYAFKDCTSLALQQLPDGLNYINIGAFNNCTSLVLARLPDGVRAIGAEAFKDCTSLELQELPQGVEEIGTDAFSGCGKLSTELRSMLQQKFPHAL